MKTKRQKEECRRSSYRLTVGPRNVQEHPPTRYLPLLLSANVLSIARGLKRPINFTCSFVSFLQNTKPSKDFPALCCLRLGHRLAWDLPSFFTDEFLRFPPTPRVMFVHLWNTLSPIFVLRLPNFQLLGERSQPIFEHLGSIVSLPTRNNFDVIGLYLCF